MRRARPLPASPPLVRRRLRVAAGWVEPVVAAAPFAEEPWCLLLASDGGGIGRWSLLARDPARTAALWPGDAGRPDALLRDLLGKGRTPPSDGPGAGVVGLAAYELGARFERLDLACDPDWPDLWMARYPAALRFDHAERAIWAEGVGANADEALAAARAAAAWLGAPPAAPTQPRVLSTRFSPEAPAPGYEAAVADVTGRIAAGELFQANIARAWTGELAEGARPFDAFARLTAQSPAPFAAFWRLPGRAVVSHSPERFVRLDGASGAVETRPIKGTRPRGRDREEDARLAAELLASAKDRAENLMIVDLMRNDLSRVCVPGSVAAPELLRLEPYAQVQHLVSTVTGRLAPGRDAADLLAATFPPGSITGAPKVQAMKVIAGHEPPRGPWCGSLFAAGFDGGLDSSVLIRTAAFVQTAEGRWRFRASAGAGIVADSDPAAERRETEAKISGLRRALTAPA